MCNDDSYNDKLTGRPSIKRNNKDKQIGREVYDKGWSQFTLTNYYQRAGWLNAALADPDSFLNKTDEGIKVGTPVTLYFKPDAIPETKVAPTGKKIGRPKGCKDSAPRKKPKIDKNRAKRKNKPGAGRPRKILSETREIVSRSICQPEQKEAS